MGECECGVTDRHSGCLLEYQSDQRHMASVQGTADPRVWRKSGVVAQLIVNAALAWNPCLDNRDTADTARLRRE